MNRKITDIRQEEEIRLPIENQARQHSSMNGGGAPKASPLAEEYY